MRTGSSLGSWVQGPPAQPQARRSASPLCSRTAAEGPLQPSSWCEKSTSSWRRAPHALPPAPAACCLATSSWVAGARQQLHPAWPHLRLLPPRQCLERTVRGGVGLEDVKHHAAGAHQVEDVAGRRHARDEGQEGVALRSAVRVWGIGGCVWRPRIGACG